MTQTAPKGPVPFRDNGHFAEAEAAFQAALAHLAKNRLAEALPLLQRCQHLNPSHYKSVRALAAIAMKNGAEAQARALMEDYYMRFPGRTVRASRLGKEPALLALRGFSGTRVIPWRSKDGTVSTRFRGGHFTAQFLVRDPDWPEHRYTIARDNILQSGGVPEHGLILNMIADPDVEESTLKTLSQYLSAHPEASVINHPDRVLPTTRDANWRRLRDVPGVLFPETHRVVFKGADADTVAAQVAALGLEDGPFILRSTGTHTARSTGLIRSRADLDAYVNVGDKHRAGAGRLDGPHYLIRYIERLWRGEYFRKLRLFHIDDRFYPVVCHLDRVWNVHGGNRKDVMRGDEVLMQEEKRFLSDWRAYVGDKHAETLDRLADLVGLEFFGVDFTFDDDDILIYEMNPAMRHSFDHAENFPYKRPHDEAITTAFTAMIRRRLAASG